MMALFLHAPGARYLCHSRAAGAPPVHSMLPFSPRRSSQPANTASLSHLSLHLPKCLSASRCADRTTALVAPLAELAAPHTVAGMAGLCCELRRVQVPLEDLCHGHTPMLTCIAIEANDRHHLNSSSRNAVCILEQGGQASHCLFAISMKLSARGLVLVLHLQVCMQADMALIRLRSPQWATVHKMRCDTSRVVSETRSHQVAHAILQRQPRPPASSPLRPRQILAASPPRLC